MAENLLAKFEQIEAREQQRGDALPDEGRREAAIR
jgi:hypothetical protein